MKHKRKVSHRSQRVADQILKDVSNLIQQEIKDTRLGFVTLQHIELTADYAHACIYVSVLTTEQKNNAQESIDVLNAKAGYLHSLLFKLLHIHTIPKLKFVLDNTQEKGFMMSQLIAQANQIHSSDVSDVDNLE
jgi:ribosome-binding factor A